MARMHDLTEQWMHQIETHPRHIRFTVYSIGSGIVNHNVRLDMGSWTTYGNTYITIVGKSGMSRKSTSARILRTFVLDPILNEAREIGMDAGMPVVASHITVQAMARIMSGGRLQGQKEDDLPDVNEWGVRPIYIIADEVTQILPRDAGETKETVTFMTAGYHGDRFDKFTKTQGSDAISRTIISFLGCTTPPVLTDLFSSELLTDGFANRMVYVYEENPRHRKARPMLDDSVLPEIKERFKNLTMMRGKMHLDGKAQDLYDEIYYGLQDDEQDPTSFIGRMMTHIEKFAMLLALFEDRMEISREDMEIAYADVLSLRADIPKLFQHVNFKNERPHMRFLENLIRASGSDGISLTELRKQIHRHLKWEECNEMLADLMASDLVHVRTVRTGGRGRPATRHIHKSCMENPPDAE